MALSPGRLMLPTRPSLTGSAAAWKTIGIASVAALAASAVTYPSDRDDNPHLTAHEFQGMEI